MSHRDQAELYWNAETLGHERARNGDFFFLTGTSTVHGLPARLPTRGVQANKTTLRLQAVDFVWWRMLRLCDAFGAGGNGPTHVRVDELRKKELANHLDLDLGTSS